MSKETKTFHLRKLRQDAGLTVRELASKIGVGHTSIVFWENNDKLPRSEVLLDMANALGVSVEAILGGPQKRTATSPKGKLSQTFNAAAKLPRRQQQKIVDIVEPFIKEHAS